MRHTSCLIVCTVWLSGRAGLGKAAGRTGLVRLRSHDIEALSTPLFGNRQSTKCAAKSSRSAFRNIFRRQKQNARFKVFSTSNRALLADILLSGFGRRRITAAVLSMSAEAILHPSRHTVPQMAIKRGGGIICTARHPCVLLCGCSYAAVPAFVFLLRLIMTAAVPTIKAAGRAQRPVTSQGDILPPSLYASGLATFAASFWE